MELTAKEEAKELVNKFYKFSRGKSSGFLVSNEDIYIENAKQCALIAQKNLLAKLKILGIKDEFEENVFSEINVL